MNFIVEGLTLVFLIVAAVSLSFFFDKTKKTAAGTTLLTFGVFMLTMVHLMRVFAIEMDFFGFLTAEELLSFFSGLFLCLFVVLYFVREEDQV